MNMIKKTLLLLPGILLLLQACLFPDNAYLMELNRAGKWNQVESIGTDMLNEKHRFTHSEICETYFHVIYARNRLGKKFEAAKLMNECDEVLDDKMLEPEYVWLKRELFMLKEELGILDGVQEKILEAMDANARGEYGIALDLCSEVLGMQERTDLQTACVYFISAVCSIRQSETEDAIKYMELYGEYRFAVPEDDPLRYEEQYAYRDLGLTIPED